MFSVFCLDLGLSFLFIIPVPCHWGQRHRKGGVECGRWSVASLRGLYPTWSWLCCLFNHTSPDTLTVASTYEAQVTVGALAQRRLKTDIGGRSGNMLLYMGRCLWVNEQGACSPLQILGPHWSVQLLLFSSLFWHSGFILMFKSFQNFIKINVCVASSSCHTCFSRSPAIFAVAVM